MGRMGSKAVKERQPLPCTPDSRKASEITAVPGKAEDPCEMTSSPRWRALPEGVQDPFSEEQPNWWAEIPGTRTSKASPDSGPSLTRRAAGLGKRPLTEQEYDALGIFGRAAGQLEYLIKYLKKYGDDALVLGVHEQAARTQACALSDTVSDDELLANVSSLARSIMAALDAASQECGYPNLRDLIRGDYDHPECKAESMQELNEMFTLATPLFLAIAIAESRDVKRACSFPLDRKA